MPLSKLTTKEIETRIDQYTGRIDSLKPILKELEDNMAKDTLQRHISSYKQIIDDLRAELSKRNRR